MPFFKWSFRGENGTKAQLQQKAAVRILFTRNGLSMSLLSCGNRNGSLSNTKLILKLLDGFRSKAVGSCVLYLSQSVSVHEPGSLPAAVKHVYATCQAQRREASGPPLVIRTQADPSAAVGSALGTFSIRAAKASAFRVFTFLRKVHQHSNNRIKICDLLNFDWDIETCHIPKIGLGKNRSFQIWPGSFTFWT